MGGFEMEGLNLFGLDIEEDPTNAGSSSQRSKESQRVVQDLLDMIEAYDDNELSNFTIRKSFVYYNVSTYHFNWY